MSQRLRSFAVATIVGIAGLQATAADQAPPAAKPAPEHQRLGYFVGKWTSEGEMKPGPMGPGGKMTSTDACEWYDGRFAVICRSDGKSPMGTSKSLSIMSYSPEEKIYTYYATDSSGMMTMTTVPRGTVKGDTWTFHDESMMGGQKMKLRVTIKEVSPTLHTFLMEVQGADGKWMPMMESKTTKVK
ncbi:MAG TPA: DUF1579 family protein [Vicinamibacterales bacterium]|nr:DUF1579 family protein [Vicinamibacterales bacterium]